MGGQQRFMAKLTIIVGLPGAGKSHRVDELRHVTSGICIPDFMKDSIEDSARFIHSQYYPQLIDDLRDGKDCVIADVAFCKTGRRAEAEQVVVHDVPGVTIEYEFFENDPAKCGINALHRNRRNVDEELQKIDDLSAEYDIPPGAKLLPVWSEEGMSVQRQATAGASHRR